MMKKEDPVDFDFGTELQNMINFENEIDSKIQEEIIIE